MEALYAVIVIILPTLYAVIVSWEKKGFYFLE